MKAKAKEPKAKPSAPSTMVEKIQRVAKLVGGAQSAAEERAEILAIVCEPPPSQFPTGETARYGSAFRDGVAAYRKLIAARG
jgi:hypothetical protein